MRTSTERKRLLSDKAVFYVEQWTALLIGLVCLGMSLWAGVHDVGAMAATLHSSPLHPKIFTEVVLLLSWLLTISVALVGVVLMRFAFRGRNEENKATVSADPGTRTGEGIATKGTRNAAFSTNGNGGQ